MILSWIEVFSAASMKLGKVIENPKYVAFEIISMLFGVAILVAVFVFLSDTFTFSQMTQQNQIICVIGILAVFPLALRLLIGELLGFVLAFIFAVLLLPLYIIYVIYQKLTVGKSKL